MLTVRFKDEDGWLDFSQPHTVLCAATPLETYEVLDRAEAALRDGYWIAGVVPYDMRATTLGVFEAPVRRQSYAGSSYRVTPPLASIAHSEYRDAIREIQRAIYDGDVYQVNYTVRFSLGIDGDPFSLWYAIAQNTDARYQAYFEDGRTRILSWSPELFLRFDGRRITTKPMKGTSKPHDTRVLHDEKNRAEHIMIVDLLRNDLRRFCDEVTVEALCTIERYPTFATMTSTIAGTARADTTLAAIFRAAFPCGSITGAPKRAAIDAISRLERHERGAYCGTLGFLSPARKGWWNVAIRTVQVDGDDARFDAGGGIVSDSNPDDEWNEIAIKSAFLRQEARDFQLWETFAGNADTETVERHVTRLLASAHQTGIKVDASRMREHVFAQRGTPSLVRVRLALDGTLTFLLEPLEEAGNEVLIRRSSARVRSSDPWLRIKSSHRPAHRIAWDEARAAGCFDALLFNEAGDVTEGSRTNLFAELDGTLCTPPLACGLLPGVLRAKLISEGRAIERAISEGDLRRASALYIGNSARGLLRARLHE